ncbi:MAG: hypothetical protein Q9166_007406 [cf. Caloplaca sp. 2 TL-2023]
MPASFLFLAYILPLLVVTVSSIAVPLNTAVSRFDASFSSQNNASATSSLADPKLSAGQGSQCITGNIQVTVTSTNRKINYPSPRNQLAVTELIVEMLQANSNVMQQLVGGPYTVSGTYSISSSLCVPADPKAAANVKTVQFLTHGDTLSSSYWDIAPGYSYIDAATAAGYATFSYDRVGVGNSEHPDPIQVVQAPLHVEIAHALVNMLRNGRVGQYRFSRFVGVGHSAGSTITQGVTTKYPKDFDAIILSGTSTIATYVPLTVAAFDFQIANQASQRFRALPNGYITQANAIGIQFSFFRYPNFDPRIFDITVRDKQTNNIGELLTLGTIVAPSPDFTGPVDVVLGEKDLVFCGGDCARPADQSAAVQPVFYPNAAAGSRHFLAPGAGHSINAHYSAPAAWNHQLSFLRANGL